MQIPPLQLIVVAAAAVVLVVVIVAVVVVILVVVVVGLQWISVQTTPIKKLLALFPMNITTEIY